MPADAHAHAHVHIEGHAHAAASPRASTGAKFSLLLLSLAARLGLAGGVVAMIWLAVLWALN